MRRTVPPLARNGSAVEASNLPCRRRRDGRTGPWCFFHLDSLGPSSPSIVFPHCSSSLYLCFLVLHTAFPVHRNCFLHQLCRFQNSFLSHLTILQIFYTASYRFLNLLNTKLRIFHFANGQGMGVPWQGRIVAKSGKCQC